MEGFMVWMRLNFDFHNSIASIQLDRCLGWESLCGINPDELCCREKSMRGFTPTWRFRRGNNTVSGRDDPRYPRPRGVAILRRILRPWWLAFIFYASNTIFNLLTIFFNQGPQGLLDTSSLVKTLLLTQLLLLFSSHIWVIVPFLT